MKRALGIDYGEKKIGLSLSAAGLAMPWRTLTNWRSQSDLVSQLKDIVDSESVDTVVVGLPRSLRGEDNPVPQPISDLVEQLSRELPVPVVLEDERLSSRLAQRQGTGAADDSQAAANILQVYLDKHKL